jgi:hypothetical protein
MDQHFDVHTRECVDLSQGSSRLTGLAKLKMRYFPYQSEKVYWSPLCSEASLSRFLLGCQCGVRGQKQ